MWSDKLVYLCKLYDLMRFKKKLNSPLSIIIRYEMWATCPQMWQWENVWHTHNRGGYDIHITEVGMSYT